MTAALFPVAVLLVFFIMLLVFCYEPESKIDAERFLVFRADNEAQAETESSPLTVARDRRPAPLTNRE